MATTSPKMDYTSRAPPNPAVQNLLSYAFGPKAAQLPQPVINATRGNCRGTTDDCYFGFA